MKPQSRWHGQDECLKGARADDIGCFSVLHTGDLHLDFTNFDQVMPALEHIVVAIKNRRPQLVVLAGDLFMRRGWLEPTALYKLRQLVHQAQEVAHVVVVPGNHDVANAAERKDNAQAALSFMGTSQGYGVSVYSEPGLYSIMVPTGPDAKVISLQLVALPSPSRFHYQAQLPAGQQATQADVSQLMTDIAHGLALGVDHDMPSVAVWHGGVQGGVADNEELMPAGQDVALPLEALLDNKYTAVMAGHLHRPQDVNGVVYCGAPAPLTFGMETVDPSFCWWEFWRETAHGEPTRVPLGWKARYKRVPIPVRHQLLTIDVPCVGPDGDPTSLAIQALSNYELDGAKVRLRIRDLPDSRRAMWDRGKVEAVYPEVHSWQVELEREQVASYRGEVVPTSDIGSLLEQWIALNQQYEPIKSPLLSLAREIEAELPYEQTRAALGGDYSPVHISWQNWKQYPHGEINFAALGRLVCVSGPNAAGKSNAAEAEAFCLYKYLRPGSTLDKVVLLGERQCWVQVVFDAQGGRWRVRRSVKLDGKGRPSGDLVLEIHQKQEGGSLDGPWVAANEGTALETQRKIERLVGPPDVFFNTRFAPQFNVDSLLNLKPVEMKALLQQAVGAQRFDYRYSAAKERGRGLALEVAELAARISGLQVLAGEQQETLKQLQKTKQDSKAAAEELDELEQLQGTLEKALAARQKERAELDKRVAVWEQHKKQRQDVQGQRKAAYDEWIGMRGLALEAEDIQARCSEIAQLDKQVQEMAVSQAEWQRKQMAAEDIASELQARTRDYDSRLQVLRAKIADTQVLVDGLAEVPCGGVGEYAGCHYLALGVKARKDMPGLKESKKQLAAAAEEEQRSLAVKLKAAKKAVAECDFDQVAMQGLERKLRDLRAGGWEQKQLEASRVKGAMAEKEQQVKRLDGMVAKAEQAEKKHAITPEELAGAVRAVEKAQAVLADCKEQIVLRQEELTQYGLRAAGAEGKLESIEKAIAEIDDIDKRKQALERKAMLVGAYAQAVSKDGLPYIMLERALPALAHRANSFMGQSPLRIEIDPIGQLQDGTVRDEVRMFFVDGSAAGRLPLSEASGYQRMQLGAAMRGALAWLYAQMGGTSVRHIWLDESFGAYDQANLAHGIEMLAALRDTFHRVLYSTHIQPVQEAADTQLRVVPGAQGSRLEVAA